MIDVMDKNNNQKTYNTIYLNTIINNLSDVNN